MAGEGRIGKWVWMMRTKGCLRANPVLASALAVAGLWVASGAAIGQQPAVLEQVVSTDEDPDESGTLGAARDMAAAAAAFLASLDESQRMKAAFPWESDERENWHYVPLDRQGVMLKELRDDQRALAHALLASGMSTRGYVKAMTIMSLEQILFEMENQAAHRDPGKYYVAVFGEPSASGTWGWRVEGHHLSVNFTLVEGLAVAATPTFFGTNPAEVREGPRAGLRVLGREEDAARELARSLHGAGKSQVIFAESAPEEILTGQERKVSPLEPVGVVAGEMDGAQKRMLRRLVAEYVRRHRGDVASTDLRKISEAGFDQVRFGWAGGLEPGQPHYYRVQGPTFVLEYANTQNNANHAHAVWRSFEGDFGRDILAEHFQADHGE